tara:strand:+ start:15962 stop:16189 length:228 start_codon:yes stop_codon:yes gene_type:complete
VFDFVSDYVREYLFPDFQTEPNKRVPSYGLFRLLNQTPDASEISCSKLSPKNSQTVDKTSFMHNVIYTMFFTQNP